MTLTSPVPVRWSLCAGCVGSLSTAGPSTTTIYTAPTGIIAQQAWLGCPVGPNDDVFHTRIDSLPINSLNNTWMSNGSALPIRIDPAWGISYADSSTPTRTLKEYYGESTLIIPNVNGYSLKREGGNTVGITGYYSAPDHHVVIVNRSICGFSEYYDDRLNGVTVTCQDGVMTDCNVQSGINYGSTNYTLPLGPNTPTDGAGLELAPLTLTLEDLKSGAVKHALRFTTALGYVYGNANAGTPLVWPATTSNGCSSCRNAPPMGARVRITSTATLSSLIGSTCNIEVNYCTEILTSLYQYGMILADIGESNDIICGSDVSTDPEANEALLEIFQSNIIFTANFAWVDESSLFYQAGSDQVTPKGALSFGGVYGGVSYAAQIQNYVTPANQAVVTHGLTTTVIAVQPVTIGTQYGPNIPVMAGSYAWTIPAWVTPSTVPQSITWTKIGGTCIGDTISDGVYTPSVTLGGATTCTTILKGVAAFDNAATVTLYLTLLPSGAVGLDYGTTSNSNVGSVPWLGGINAEGSGYSNAYQDIYPAGWSNSGALQEQFNTGYYYQGDQTQAVIVPNGNYDITYLLGINSGACTGQAVCTGYYGLGLYNFGPYQLETQSNVMSAYLDVQPEVGYGHNIAAPLVTVPAKVTDNVLTVALRSLSNDTMPTYAAICPALYCSSFSSSNSNKYTVLSGIEIAPDSGPPKWTIDAEQQSTISPGQTLLPLRVVDWFTGTNKPTWTIVSGPTGASINSAGTLTLSPTASPAGQPIVVRASNGTYSTTVSINTPGIPPIPVPTVTPISRTTPTPPTTNGTPGIPGSKVSNYAYSRTLTIAHQQVSKTDQTAFPVVVAITDPILANTANGGHVLSVNGYDIILTSDAAGQNLLHWELEAYDSVAGSWVGHVQVPLLSHTQDTTIYLFYGNAAVTRSLATPTAVWDTNYLGVYHFALPTELLEDSTGAGNNGTPLALGYTNDGELAGAAVVTAGAATLPETTLSQPTGTIELWVNSASPQDASHNGYLMAQNWNDDQNQFHLGWSAYNKDFEVMWYAQGQVSSLNASAAQMPMAVNTWNQVVYTWDRPNSKQNLYLNGALVTNSTRPFGIPTFNTLLSLSIPSNPTYYGLQGMLDEARFSSTVRSADWIKTEYLNQARPTSFIAVGAEHKASSLPVIPASVPSPYSYKRTLTIAHQQVSKTDQTAFPVVVAITDPILANTANGGHVLSVNGYDIILTSDAAGQSLLHWELEAYDSVAGSWVGHVQVPLLSHTQDTTIYLFYGNAAVTRSLATPTAVWDTNYLGVYHFALPTELLEDSTGAGNNGTPLALGYTNDGELAGAAVVTAGAATLPETTLSQPTGTIELWVNSASPQDASHNGYLMAQNWNDDQNQFHLGWSAYNKDFEVMWYAQGQVSSLNASAAQMPMAVNTWNQVVYTWDRPNSKQNLYLNGALVTNSTRPFGIPTFNTLLSLSIPSNPTYYGLQGMLDEARFSSTVRSADWIKTEYLNQARPTSFIAVGAEQASLPTTTGAVKQSRLVPKTVMLMERFVVFVFKSIRHGLAQLV